MPKIERKRNLDSLSLCKEVNIDKKTEIHFLV